MRSHAVDWCFALSFAARVRAQHYRLFPPRMPRWPARLAIRGPNITFPDGTPAQLRGFNLLFQLDTPFASPREDTDLLLPKLLPKVNVVRLVMLHWDDSPTENAGPSNQNDCSEVQHEGHSLRERCLEQFDAVLKWTAEQGLWAILTARASIAAGDDSPENPNGYGDTFFNDAALKARFLSSWKTIAERYKSYEKIAGFELLSEPRVQPQTVPAKDVRAFYEELVTAVQAVDARTPLLIGPAPYYDRLNLPDIIMPAKRNIIYNFNFFVPRAYVQQLDSRLHYPGNMPCCGFHDKDHRACCPSVAPGTDLSKHACCAAPVVVDRSALESALIQPLQVAQNYGVPVLLDQWGVTRGAPGRVGYLQDMLGLLEKHRVHWTYWQWRHKSDRPFAVVYERDSQDPEPHVDVDALLAFGGVLGASDAAGGAELARYRNARCYAQQYPDLLKAFCEDDIEACLWRALMHHWEEHGKQEGRVFDCTSQACWPFCAEHSAPWGIKCTTFRRCRECPMCLPSASPTAPSPRPPLLPPAPQPDQPSAIEIELQPVPRRPPPPEASALLPPPSPRVPPRIPPPPPSPRIAARVEGADGAHQGAAFTEYAAHDFAFALAPPSSESGGMSTLSAEGPSLALATAALIGVLALGAVIKWMPMPQWRREPRKKRSHSSRSGTSSAPRRSRGARGKKAQQPERGARGAARYERVVACECEDVDESTNVVDAMLD